MKRAILHHIEHIRNSNEHTKRWWIIIATAIVMCVIVALWIFYLSATLPQAMKLDTIGDTTQEPTNKELSVVESVIEGIKLTLGNISSSFREAKNGFLENVQKTIQITTKGEEKPKINQKQKEIETPFQPNEAEQPEHVLLP